MRNSRKWVNASVVGILLVLLFLLAVQIYNYFFLALKSEYAVKGSIEDTFDVSGLICREEHVLSGQEEGYYDIILTDGEKVSKGGTIANVYKSEEDVKAKEQVRLLAAEIEDYAAAISARASYSGDYSPYEQQIQSALSEYAGALNHNDAFAAQEALKSFEKNVFIKEIVTGSVDDYQQRIRQLRAEISSLESKISGTVSSLFSDSSGFYVRNVDGFESEFSPEKMEKLSLSQFNDAFEKVSKEAAKTSGNIGKIISGYDWIYYFTVPTEKVSDYKVGNKIQFRFPSITEDKISGIISSLKVEGDRVLMGVTFSALNSDFLSVRTLDGMVISKSYEGIRVDKNSVRLVDGESGVYVKVGQIVRFKKAEVLYMGTSYALLDPNGSVKNFDEVIVGGKNIYDGKAL